MKRKVIKIITAALVAFALSPANLAFAGQTLYNCSTGVEDGFNYELWKDNGNTTMTLNGGGAFSCSWNNINNALFRKGKKFDCTKTYQQIGNIKIDFDCDYRPQGNSYLCVYGWSKNPLVEYYIVESWGTWRPPGAQSKGTITVDGAIYDVYETDRINQPSIEGNTTFKQYWSVRRTKRTSGTISVTEHFKAWERMGMRLGNLYEVALNVEGYQSSGTANVTKNVLTIGGSSSGSTQQPTQPNQPNQPAQPQQGVISDGWYYIKNVHAQKYLQVQYNAANNAQNVELASGTGASGQKWYVKNLGNGYFTLQSRVGNFMLDIANGANADGANAQIYSAYSGDPQQFTVRYAGNGNYAILSKCSYQSKALDAANWGTSDGTNVCQWSYSGGNNQLWKFERIG